MVLIYYIFLLLHVTCYNRLHVIFFSPCRSLFGVNHLIVFETNRAIVSRSHTTFACRSSSSSSFSSPLTPSFRPLRNHLAAAFRFVVEPFPFYWLPAKHRSSHYCEEKEGKGMAGIRTLDLIHDLSNLTT